MTEERGRQLLATIREGMGVVDTNGTRIGSVARVEGGHLKILRIDPTGRPGRTGRSTWSSLGLEMTRHRGELLDLPEAASADTRTIDLQLVGETIEDLPQPSKFNGAAVVPVEEQA
jgi:hypothetical protein